MKKNKNSLLILAVFLVLSLISGIQEFQNNREGLRQVTRQEEGSASETRTFSFSTGGETGDIELDVYALERSAEEAEKLLETAVQEWEETYLGSNASMNAVNQNLVLPETLCDGLVSVSYSSSDDELLDEQGNLFDSEIPETGAEVELQVEFTYGDLTRVEIRVLRLVPPEKGSRAWLVREVRKALREAESVSREKPEFDLPRSIAGQTIRWERPREYLWCYFLLLGVAAAFCLRYRDREAAKKARQKREEGLTFEYPQMVEQMALLLGSGMTIRSAWEKILAAASYAGRDAPGRKKLYIEEMWLTYREIREGCGESEAYERFGSRIGLIPYRRFASILSQNLSKGTRDVREQLAEEARVALDLRKNQARRLGEEAGTKLLFPMLLMFVLILVVLLMPAAQQFF